MEPSHYVGLDVSQELTSICVVDEQGAIIWRGKCATDPDVLTRTVGQHAPHLVRAGLETRPGHEEHRPSGSPCCGCLHDAMRGDRGKNHDLAAMTPDLAPASRRARLRQDRCTPLRGVCGPS